MGSVNIPGDLLQNCVTGRKYYGVFPSCFYTRSPVVWGLVVGTFGIGAIIGAVLSNPIIDKRGYKFTMTWFALLNVGGALLLSLATKIPQFIIGRLLVGVAAGAANNALAVYVSDISTPRGRNILSGTLQFATNFGIMVDNACALGLTRPPRWRVLMSLTGVLGLINFVLFPFAPESPKWLIKHDRRDEAHAALTRLRKGANIEHEFNDIIESDQLNRQRTTDVNVMQVLRGQTPDNLRHQLMCVSALMFFQQLCGINAVIFYSTQIINKSTKANPANMPTLAQILAFLISVAALVFTFFGMLLAAFIGRRILLIFSHLTMAIFASMLVLGSVKNLTGLVVVMVFLFNAFFNLGVGPIPWAAASEMTPMYAMTAMSAVGTGIGYLFTFGIGVFFPAANNWWKNYTFFFFMGFNLGAALFVYLFVPETKDRRIEDTVRLHSCGIHFVVGKKWRLSAVEEKADLAGQMADDDLLDATDSMA
ncbi:general substrate transporter [Linderina pennispora]|uniref:General substrate transporter n=1 Tax=Linderina pennispora TaxID=61395 RepID=A0A1Y1WAA9_9FUNG|nr:general substrate transporter [Linderina pennispora]ORX70463.1 general substrate transporter [Linderina pennispora]